MQILTFAKQSVLYFFVLTLLQTFYSCHSTSTNHREPVSVPTAKTRVVLQPFSDFKKQDAIVLSGQLKNLGLETEVAEPLVLPSFAWRSSRARYRADSLIRYLSGRTPSGDVTIGLTHYDVSTTKGGNEDWGVMGLGYMPGKACVVSTFRIRGKNKEEKYAKVVIHEFGHTRGLGHCPIKTCLMRDAEGKDHLDEEKGFCNECTDELKKAGYSLYK